jgi:hypothetical protein
MQSGSMRQTVESGIFTTYVINVAFQISGNYLINSTGKVDFPFGKLIVAFTYHAQKQNPDNM